MCNQLRQVSASAGSGDGARRWGHEHTSSRLVLRLTASDSSDAVGIEAYPGDRLQVFATAECARYPEGTPLDRAGDPQLGAPQAPSTLRH
ncbi:hypothetical protein [Streptomyces sp. NPDC056670]|uniref:hypothetical protein n=1 Tax=Streptomyces sp. NPDC056670 TaxID=3345904 RepID=UPI0036AA6493